MSLLTIVQDVCDLVGIQRPATVGVNSDTTYSQIRALVNQACDDLRARHDWSDLSSIVSYTSVAGERQPDMKPEDYDRMASGHTLMDKRNDWPVRGPLSPTEWAEVHWRSGSAELHSFWRFLGNDFLIYPVLPAGTPLTFEYLSRNHVMLATGEVSDRLRNDTDVSILPEELIILATVWRWRSSKGFAYAEDLSNFERQFERIAGAESSDGAIVLRDRRDWRDMGWGSGATPTGPINAASRVRASGFNGN